MINKLLNFLSKLSTRLKSKINKQEFMWNLGGIEVDWIKIMQKMKFYWNIDKRWNLISTWFLLYTIYPDFSSFLKTKLIKHHLFDLFAFDFSTRGIYDKGELRIHFFLNFWDQVFWDSKVQKSCLHMFPRIIKMLSFYFHVFVQTHHIGALILLGSVKKLRQKKLHCCVQFNNITDVLQKEWIDSIVCQNMLVKLSDYSSEVLVTSNFFKKSGHLMLCNL